MAGMLGCGGGPETLFFCPAALRRRDWRKAAADARRLIATHSDRRPSVPVAGLA